MYLHLSIQRLNWFGGRFSVFWGLVYLSCFVSLFLACNSLVYLVKSLGFSFVRFKTLISIFQRGESAEISLCSFSASELQLCCQLEARQLGPLHSLLPTLGSVVGLACNKWSLLLVQVEISLLYYLQIVPFFVSQFSIPDIGIFRGLIHNDCSHA